MPLRLLNAVIIASLIAETQGQSPMPDPEFEVASIKPSPPPGYMMIVGCFDGPGTKDPVRFRCTNVTLDYMIGKAFDLGIGEFKDYSGVNGQKFDLAANVPPGTTKEQFLTMFQALMKQRFHMTYHRVPGQADGYELVIAKGGPKLVPSPQHAPVSSDDEVVPTPSAEAPKLDKDGFPVLQGDGALFANNRANIRYHNQTMDDIAVTLSRYARGKVVDRTGLGDGKYDVALHWVIEGRDSQAAEDSGPNFFSAVQSQLGLKLESKKIGVSVFVVDHADKMPTDN
jgi:uncharacterized protein (TIGR03435 family)